MLEVVVDNQNTKVTSTARVTRGPFTCTTRREPHGLVVVITNVHSPGFCVAFTCIPSSTPFQTIEVDTLSIRGRVGCLTEEEEDEDEEEANCIVKVCWVEPLSDDDDDNENNNDNEDNAMFYLRFDCIKRLDFWLEVCVYATFSS